MTIILLLCELQELRRFLRKIKRANPERSCFLEYDKLYVDHKVYVYSEALGQVTGGGQAFNCYRC